MVPLAGLEPARCCHHLILSQARLPIPPQGQAGRIIAAKRRGSTPIPLPCLHQYMTRRDTTRKAQRQELRNDAMADVSTSMSRSRPLAAAAIAIAVVGAAAIVGAWFFQ